MKFNKFKDHILNWKESYLYIPISICILLGSLYFYRFLTGRSSIEDVNSIVGYSLNFINIVLAGAATGLIKIALFTDLSDQETKALPFWRVYLDSLETLIIFLVTLYVIRN